MLIFGERYSGEIAIGYYDTTNAKRANEFFVGVERYHRFYTISGWLYDPMDSLNISAIKPFVQYDIGFLNSDKCGLGISNKFGLLIFDQYLWTHKSSLNDPKPYIFKWTKKMPVFFWEPSITYRFGWRQFNFQLQAGYPVGYIPAPYDENKLFFNAGISFRFGGKKVPEPEKQ
jgi:hypothetical protein